MAKVKLTAGRIAAFECAPNKAQSFLWCSEVQGLAVRATPSSNRKRYIFETKIQTKTARMTIGEVSTWTIPAAQAEARRLQAEIDQGHDPRQQRAEKAAKNKQDANAATAQQVTMTEAWEAYVKERSASMIDGKPEWGDRHKQHLASFVQAGGDALKRGKGTTRQGILYPLMAKRLADLDATVITEWLAVEIPKAPTSTAKAFSSLRAFLTWCTKHESYSAVTHANACQADAVKRKVPRPKVKANDSLRRAQIKPWFEAVSKINNPIIAAYLQCLLLSGARRNELAGLRWQDVDFQWKSMTIRDKVEGERTIPLTPFVEHLISPLARRNQFVFSSDAAKSGKIQEPRHAHNRALTNAALPALSLHGLRRSFATLSEWVEVPVGVVAQIMGHKPSAVAEQHYIQRELDLLALWHCRIESWILNEAGIEIPTETTNGLRVVA